MRKPFHMRKKWQDYHATHCQQGPDPDCLACHPEGRPLNPRRFVLVEPGQPDNSPAKAPGSPVAPSADPGQG